MNRHKAAGMRTGSAVSARWRALADGPAPQLPFSDENMGNPCVHLGPKTGSRAIEYDSFPFEALNDIAEIESWRKEINRPTTHIHKAHYAFRTVVRVSCEETEIG